MSTSASEQKKAIEGAAAIAGSEPVAAAITKLRDEANEASDSIDSVSSDIPEANRNFDFISEINKASAFLSAKKETLVSLLDKMITRGGRDVRNLSEAFRLLLQTDKLSTTEKISWITKNIAVLPAPFLLLNAAFYSMNPETLKEAGAWFAFAKLRLEIDTKKCNDYGNALFAVQKIYIAVWPLMKLDKSNPVCAYELFLNSIEGCLSLHKLYPLQVSHPYWLTNFKDIKKLDTAKDAKLFKPVSEWLEIEESQLEIFRQCRFFSKGHGPLDAAEISDLAAQVSKQLKAAPEFRANFAIVLPQARCLDHRLNVEIIDYSGEGPPKISNEAQETVDDSFRKEFWKKVQELGLKAGMQSLKLISGSRKLVAKMYDYSNYKHGEPVMVATNVGSADPGFLRAGLRLWGNYVLTIYDIRKTAGHDFIIGAYTGGMGRPDAMRAEDVTNFGVINTTSEPDYASKPVMPKQLTFSFNAKPTDVWIDSKATFKRCHSPEPGEDPEDNKIPHPEFWKKA